MAVRHPTHRWWAGAAVSVLLTACAQASAEPPPTKVAGTLVERSDLVVPVFDPADPTGVSGAGEAVVAPTRDVPAATVPATTAPAAVAPTVPPAAVTTTLTTPPSTTAANALAAVRPASEKLITATVGGVERQWTLVVPPNTPAAQRLPLLIVLHGVGGKGAAMRRLGFERFTSPAGYMVAYPDAFGGSWNDGRPGMEPLAGTPVDDVAFLRELIARTVADSGADPARVAVTGFSNGALMASRVACDLTDQLASVVMVSGVGPKDMTQRCTPTRPLPVLVVFGTADTVVPYDGGQVAMYGGKSRGQVAPVREALDIWRKVNGCTNTETQAIVGTTPLVTAVKGTGCRADVLHLKVQGGGHDWVTNAGFDTTTEAWRFVAAHGG